jgi:probable phosphoglycerate mutase
MRILLLRHAATAWTATGQHTGRTDLELTPAGEAEARATAALFTEVLGREQRLAATYVSPRRRALRTAELVLGPPASFSVEPALAEVDYGDFEGLTPSQIQAQTPGWSLWEHGCPGGEGVADVAARIDGFIARLRDCHAEDTVCAVAHGHLLRGLAARLLGLPLREARIVAVGTCAIGDFVERDGRFRLAAWNRRSVA